MPYRWAVFGILGSIIFIGIFTSAAGMAVWVAAFFFGFYFILAVAITRVRAEVGTPHELLFVNPQLVMTTVFGTRQIDSASLTIIALFAWFNRGYRSHPMPNQIEAFKMANATGMRYRGFLGAMLIAAVVGIAASFWANLDMTFRDGVVTQARGAQYAMSWRSFGLLRGWLLNPSDADAGWSFLCDRRGRCEFFHHVYADAVLMVALPPRRIRAGNELCDGLFLVYMSCDMGTQICYSPVRRSPGAPAGGSPVLRTDTRRLCDW